MNARWTVSLAAGMAVLFCGSLLATAEQPATQDSARIVQNSTLVGTAVLDPQGQQLGQIRNVLFDAQSGQATFVVIDAKASNAAQAMLVVPYPALRVTFNTVDNHQTVVLDLRADQVATAPQIQNAGRCSRMHNF